MTDLGDRAKACRAQPWRSSQLLTHRPLQLGCGQRQNCRCSQVSGRPCMLANAMLTIKLLKMHRSVKGFTPEHYSLPTSAGDLALITAVGDSVELAYHKSRLGGTVTLLPTKVGASQCKICAVFPLSIIVFFLSVLFPFHFRSTPACVNLLRSSTSLT